MVIGTLSLLTLTWQFAVWWWKLHPIVLPPPTQVAQVAWSEASTLSRGFMSTATAALAGLGTSILVGTFVAILFSQSIILRRMFYPYVVFLQTVPIVAIAPLLITWSGYRWRTIVIVSVIISLFPIISNVTAGLISVDRNLQDLFRLNRASKWQTLIKLHIPFAIRHLVLGTRISAGLAVIGAVVGEFSVGPSQIDAPGLGTIMTSWLRSARTDALIAAALTSTLLGLLILGIVNLVSYTLLRKWTSDIGFENA